MSSLDQKNQIIVQHNDLIEAHYKLAMIEKKLVLIVASMVKPDDKDFQSYTLTVKQVQEILEVKGKDYYNQLRLLTKEILKKPLSIKIDTGWLNCNWFSSIRYYQKEGSIKFRFDPDLKPYLLELKDHFTGYELKYALQLRSFYSIRLYELLKQYLKIGKREISLEKFRIFLGIGVNQYPKYSHLKNRVIDPACREINKGSDLRINYKEKKHVRRVVSLVFEIKKAWIVPQDVLKSLPTQYQNDRRIISVLNRYAAKGEDVLKSIIAYVVDQKPTHSFAGYLNHCLENSFGASYLSDSKQPSLFPDPEQKPLVPVFQGLQLRIKDKIFTVEGGNVIRLPNGCIPEGQIRKLISDGIAVPVESDTIE